MSEPLATVIVPVYNTMPYLTACLDSLVGQTIGLEQLQVVAVDDGSDDGSAEELDRYAALHPEIVVLHQPNSGGPAQPCNRGLEHATGRYVFFLGADDHLGPEAMERLVAAAEDWDADVVVGRMEGVNGRYVDQRMFTRNEPDVDFVRFPLAYSMSNTKLFRRSLLEKHHVRYALDLRVGSDQPFVVEAMTHARRISVLADYTCYYAVRREDASNITYATLWRVRLDDVAAIMGHIAEVVPPGPVRDAIFRRHFDWELDKLVRVSMLALGEPEQRELAAGVAALADAYLTPGVSDQLTAPARVRLRLAQRGDLHTLHRTLAYSRRKPHQLLVLAPDRVYQWLPGFREAGPGCPDDWYEACDRSPKWITAERAEVERHTLTLTGEIDITPESADQVQIVLVPLAPDEAVPPAGRHRRAAATSTPTASFAVELEQPAIGGPSRFRAAVDLRQLPSSPARTPTRRWAVRWALQVGPWSEDRPLLLDGVDLQASVRRGLRRAAVRVVSEQDAALVLAAASSATPERTGARCGSA